MATAKQLRFFVESGLPDVPNHQAFNHPNVSVDLRLDSRYTTDASGYLAWGTETDPLALSHSLVKILQRKAGQLAGFGFGAIGNRFHVVAPGIGAGIIAGGFGQEGYYPLCRSITRNAADRKAFADTLWDQARMISVEGTVSGGTFTITCNGATTANIAWNATPSTIATAVNALGVLSGATVTGFSTVPFDYAGNVPLPGTVYFLVRNGSGSEITPAYVWSLNAAGLTGGGTYRLALRPAGRHAFDNKYTYDFAPLNWHGRQAQEVLRPFFAQFPTDIQNAGFGPLQLFQITSESGVGDDIFAFHDATDTTNLNGWLTRLMNEPEWDGKDPRFFVDGARMNAKAFWESSVDYNGNPLPAYERDTGLVGPGWLAGRHGRNHEPTLAARCMAYVGHSYGMKKIRDMLTANSGGTRLGEYTIHTCGQGASKSVLYSPNTFQPGYLHNMRGLLPGHDCQCPEISAGMMEWYGSQPIDYMGMGTSNNWADQFGWAHNDPDIFHKLIVATDLLNIRAMAAANKSKPVIPYMTANVAGAGFLTAQQMVDEVLTPLITDPTGQKIHGLHYFAPYDNPTNMTARWDYLQEMITRLNTRFRMVGDGSFTGVTGAAQIA